MPLIRWLTARRRRIRNNFCQDKLDSPRSVGADVDSEVRQGDLGKRQVGPDKELVMRTIKFTAARFIRAVQRQSGHPGGYTWG